MSEPNSDDTNPRYPSMLLALPLPLISEVRARAPGVQLYPPTHSSSHLVW